MRRGLSSAVKSALLMPEPLLRSQGLAGHLFGLSGDDKGGEIVDHYEEY